MKRLEKLSMVAVMLLLSVTMAFAQQKPNIHILATGGTIAGTGTSATATNYTAGQVAIGTLLDAVPELKNIANVTGEQIVKIGSQDMNDDVWLTLAKKINQLLKRSDIDGIVITHGYDGRNGLFPQPDGQERQTGSSGRSNAPLYRNQRRRTS